jgi:alkylation response protein AidB-like acyl-CoA dehydrogenase
MDLTPSPEEREYRETLREWLAANAPATPEGELHNPANLEPLRRWQRTLAEAGYLGITWPKEYGGQGLGPVEQAIFLDEMALAQAPPVPGRLGLNLVGPTIINVGTEEQKKAYVLDMLLGDKIWVQGFSEPNAGSDLGSLGTRAVRDGDVFVVNGQKIWTSYAHFADYVFLLVRTDPEAPKFKGITCLLVDMKLDGVSVKPLKMMSGDSGFNEIFFTDVRVPESQVLGEINDGWKVGMTALMHERSNLGGGSSVILSQFLDELKRAVREMRLTGDQLVRQKVAQCQLELEVFRMTTARAQSKIGRGGAPGPESSILKLFRDDFNQRMAQMAQEILGPYGQLTGGAWEPFTYNYLRSRGHSIEAGTTQVLKNNIATRVLGLPKSY